MTSGKPLPEGWTPSKDDECYAYDKLGLTPEDVQNLAEDMRLWAGANANRQIARKANWSLAFKGCMRREAAKMKGRYNGFGGPRPLQDNSLSAGRAAGRLAEKAERGELFFGPIPSLLPTPSANDVRLLPKGRGPKS